jgi:hypothetical protein
VEEIPGNSHAGVVRSYTRVPGETVQNRYSPLWGRQNGPLMCQAGGGSITHVEKARGRAFVSLVAVEASKSRRRVPYWSLDVTTKTR